MARSFQRLQETIIECRKCPRLVEWRERVALEKVRRYRSEEYWGRPVPAFGEATAALLVVGLAPGAHGANRTGRMFTGDRSGEWFYEALHRFGFASQPDSTRLDDGLRLHDCAVTAALRCAPPANQPLPCELDNCRPYLRRELLLLTRKRVIIVLGQIALRAFLKVWRENGGKIPGDRIPGFRHAGEWDLPGGVTLISSYHPSQQNTQTGRLTRSMFHDIFRRARRLLDG
ncbi:MAG: uracil-DNA glycosylase [Acidobacteriia bacterium]|nr:uracil-DNA glycosylase [Terriglobia bacterium]